jgi:hypothetical protein
MIPEWKVYRSFTYFHQLSCLIPHPVNSCRREIVLYERPNHRCWAVRESHLSRGFASLKNQRKPPGMSFVKFTTVVFTVRGGLPVACLGKGDKMKFSGRIGTWKDVKELGSPPQFPDAGDSDSKQNQTTDGHRLPYQPSGWSRVVTPPDRAEPGD